MHETGRSILKKDDKIGFLTEEKSRSREIVFKGKETVKIRCGKDIQMFSFVSAGFSIQ